MKFIFNIDISWKIWYIFHRVTFRFCKRPFTIYALHLQEKKGELSDEKAQKNCWPLALRF